MKKLLTLIIGFTLLCGSLFPAAAAQGETKYPRHSELIPPPSIFQEPETAAEEVPGSGSPRSLAGTAGAGAADALALPGAGVQSGSPLTVSCDGFTAELVSYGVNQYNTASPDLFLYFHIINNSGQTLDMRLEDASVDGVEIMGLGIYDIEPGYDSKDTPERLWFMALSDNPAGEEAILNARTVHGTIILKDQTPETLLLQEFTVDLSQLDGEWNDFRTNGDSSDNYTESEPFNYAPSPSYRTLQLGDTGEDVKELQLKLIELGYLNDTADGSFGPKTAAAVKDFNEANGLESGTVADFITQDLAFSGLANPYTEPWIPLTIGANFYYDPIPSVNTFFFKVEVTNHSKNRTIRGYELSVYYTNVWGDWLDGGVTYTQTMTQTVEPGQTIYSANFNLGNWYSVDTVWVGVSKIVFDDGEIREADDIDYYSCKIPTRIN